MRRTAESGVRAGCGGAGRTRCGLRRIRRGRGGPGECCKGLAEGELDCAEWPAGAYAG